jgi:hypothetical protein
MQNSLVILAIIVAVAVVLIVALLGVAASRRRAPFDVHGLPAGHVSAYQQRLLELQAMFVDHPREAVAGVKQVVDDMLMRMGYPSRLGDRERLDDLRRVDRSHADLYKSGTNLGDKSTTEEMRRAMQHHLELARRLLDRAETPARERREGRPEIAG